MFPALVGRLLSTVPPGKSLRLFYECLKGICMLQFWDEDFESIRLKPFQLELYLQQKEYFISSLNIQIKSFYKVMLIFCHMGYILVFSVLFYFFFNGICKFKSITRLPQLGKKCVSDHLLIVLFKFSISFTVLSVKYLFRIKMYENHPL